MNAAAARESRTMLDKIWAEHTIVSQPGGEDLLYVDLNLVHEGGTFMAFDAMRAEGRRLRKPKLTLAVTDHYLPSLNRSSGVAAIPNPANPQRRRVARREHARVRHRAHRAGRSAPGHHPCDRA
jgi:homoaconitase/3-isopropylmalate dehydratase large subunit